jgi:hypothetical protein
VALDFGGAISELYFFAVEPFEAALEGVWGVELCACVGGQAEQAVLEFYLVRFLFEDHLYILFADVVWQVEDEQGLVIQVVLVEFFKSGRSSFLCEMGEL